MNTTHGMGGVVVAVLSTSCVTLSPTTRQQLLVKGAVAFVRAPTPTVTVRIAGKAAQLNPVLGDGMSILEGPLWKGGRAPRTTELNVTDRFGVQDPADLLAVATMQQFERLGFPAPTAMPGLLVRFENDPPSRWPAALKTPGELLLHAQVDDLEVGTGGFPLTLRASLTLFVAGEVELHTRCAEQSTRLGPDLTRADTWVELLRRCAQILLAPFAAPPR